MARFTSRSRGRDPYLRAIAKATRKGGFFAGFARRRDRIGSACREGGVFCAPGHGGRVPPHFLFYGACWGRFRAPARGPFGTAQKGRKGRLGAAAPKNPINVQHRAYFSYRRVGIVLPLRPLPGLRPCPGGQPSHFSHLAAPGAAGEGAGSFPASLHRTINSKRSRETTTFLS